MADDLYYKVCCLTGIKTEKIDFHHVFQYGQGGGKGGQINEKWNILPIIWRKHSQYGDKDSVHNCLETREFCMYLAMRRTTLQYLCEHFPKKNWKQIWIYLQTRYNIYTFKDYGK